MRVNCIYISGDLHEISSLIFLEKQKKKKEVWMLAVAVVTGTLKLKTTLVVVTGTLKVKDNSYNIHN